MKKITNALSNTVYLDEENNTIIKNYSKDKFKELYGNQEIKVLTKLGYNIKEVRNGEISIEYFDHEPFNDEKMSMEDIVLVAKALNELHSIDPKGMERPGFEKVYTELLLKYPYPVVDYMDDYEGSIAKQALTILKSGKQVVLHNDVVEGNLLKINGKIKLIDFEYSGIGNPIFDLASFCTEREISQAQIDMLFSLYNDKIDKDDFIVVCAFLQAFWARWALFKFDTTGKDIYKEIAFWKLDKYKELIKNFS